MTGRVHPTAVIDARAEVGSDVEIGPYAIVGPSVEIGEGCRIAAHAVIQRDTRIGCGCEIGVGAALGGDPQDRKYHGEPTRLEVGSGTIIREYATIHRGTAASGLTHVGAGCFLMAYVHVGHDCRLGNQVTLANAVQLAGHVTVDAGATVGGSTPVHQFVRIGRLAFVGGGSRVPQDVPPFTKAAGNPIRLYGLNVLGLERGGVSAQARRDLKRAYRLLFNSDMLTSEAAAVLREEFGDGTEVRELIDFVTRSERGVLV